VRHRVILLRLNHLHRVTLPHQVAVEVAGEEAAVEVAVEEVGVEVAEAEAVEAAVAVEAVEEEEAPEDDRQLKKLTEAPP
jgi:hypothetical protein